MNDPRPSQDLQARVKELEALAWFSHMVPGLAHDLNTLLGICITATSHLQGQVSRLKSDFDGGKLGKAAFAAYLDHLGQASELLAANLGRANALTGSLKHLTVSQARQEPEMVDLGTLLGEISLAFSPQLKQHPHRLEVRAPEVLVIRTRSGELTRVLLNLVQNAMVHAFPDGRAGHILLQAEATEGGASLKVADDGAGMDKEILARIFEPYFTTSREGGGSGLGLPLCRDLVEGPLGGRLSVESVPGYGSTFHISLPSLTTDDGGHHE
ncbi:MAG TPA: HAMP domain-containing sensor histidine kinase [Holophagaceae bacterium]|nr:HAMP domain-containing sensor histidine kinase [Holophagaceae bacterium]